MSTLKHPFQFLTFCFAEYVLHCFKLGVWLTMIAAYSVSQVGNKTDRLLGVENSWSIVEKKTTTKNKNKTRRKKQGSRHKETWKLEMVPVGSCVYFSAHEAIMQSAWLSFGFLRKYHISLGKEISKLWTGWFVCQREKTLFQLTLGKHFLWFIFHFSKC